MAVSERRGLARWSPAEWGPRLLLLLRLGGCSGRIHRLVLTGEKRADTQLNSFGFYTDGSLEVDVSLQETEERTPQVGFSLSRVRSGGIQSYPTRDPQDCPLLKNSSHLLVLFLINTKDVQVQVRKYGKQKNLFISPRLLPKAPPEPGLPKPEHTASPKGRGITTMPNKARPKHTVSPGDLQAAGGKDKELVLDLGHRNNFYNFSFHVVTGSRAKEGLYTLSFYNCYNLMPRREQPLDITVQGLQDPLAHGSPGLHQEHFSPLPQTPTSVLIITISSMNFPTTHATVTIHVLKPPHPSTSPSICLTVHPPVHRQINYDFINSQSHPIEGLAVMHYITHLLKGALLFITIALIGSGLAFIKYVLSDKENIFGIIIPLQVLANVAYIVTETRAEGASDHRPWREILSWWTSSAVVPSSFPWSGPSGTSRTRLALTERWQ